MEVNDLQEQWDKFQKDTGYSHREVTLTISENILNEICINYYFPNLVGIDLGIDFSSY